MDQRLADGVRAATSLRTVLLEPLDFDSHVMLLLDAGAPAPPGHRWVPRTALRGMGGAAERWIERTVDRRPPWFRPDWYPRAVEYVDRALSSLGLGRVGPIEQVRHWSMSAVLRAKTTDGLVYLKAVAGPLRREPRVNQVLAQRWPNSVPSVLAHDPVDEWWLTADFGHGENVPEQTRATSVRLLAQMQLTMVENTGELAAAGCQRQTLEDLAVDLRVLLARDDLWRAESQRRNLYRGLSDQERRRLAAAGPFLVECCERLAAEELPLTLVHGDFHAGNAIWRQPGVVLTDWSFALVGVPLFDLAAWLHDTSEANGRAALAYYWDVWGRLIDPGRLHRAWLAAKPLGGVMEVGKFVAMADAVGPDYDFNWLPMAYSWVRRLLNAVDDPDASTVGWRK